MPAWQVASARMGDPLSDIAARLASGSPGRTEADIQSDVRKFLLDAPLELEDHQVVQVSLEAQAGGGRRIDVEAGCAAIEVKKNLGSAKVFDEAREQLAGYVQARTEERKLPFVGVLTDGRLWVLFHLVGDGTLAEVSRLEITGGEDAARLASWLEIVLATTEKVTPFGDEIVARLGAGSPATQLALADLRSLYLTCRDDPEVKLKRELWGRLLVAALGQNFEDSDELFVTHTYLVLTAELLAHELLGLGVDAATGDVRGLLEGAQFTKIGLHGVVEADFFDWPAVRPEGELVVRSLARRLSRFDWDKVDHDVMKVLYESVIDTETRHQLGEYYTPDWLADRMVSQTISDPLEQRVLDPACGSGTFLFWAIRRFLDAAGQAGISNKQAVAQVVDHVQGIDLHPVAVTLARVTYLLAITPARLLDREELTVPVFLGDSVRWEQDKDLLSKGGITIHTSDGLELFAQELHFPDGVVEDPGRFDRLVAELARRASDRKIGTKPPEIDGLLNRHKITDTGDRESVTTVFKQLCHLNDHGRDHIWAYYVRNLARPLSFTRPERQVDVLVGNPPWLAYRHMPPRLQDSYRYLAKSRGLWVGGKVATNQDLSDLFVARAVEQYLKPGGRFSFVMPFSTLSRRQYAGFRTAEWSPKSGEQLQVQFDTPQDFARIKPSVFPVPSCVVSGAKAGPAKPLSADATVWQGNVPSPYLDWTTASQLLHSSEQTVQRAVDSDQSPYRALFAQGATFVPRVLVIVQRESAGPLGMASGQVAIRSSRSTIEKPPWKDVPTLEGVVEGQFVHPLALGASIAPFCVLDTHDALVPWAHDRLLDGDDPAIDEFPGLAKWWREAERIWDNGKSKASKMSLRDRLDFQRGLSRQFPAPPERVVYTASGMQLAACRIADPAVVVEHKLYWAPVSSPDEGRYLTAILNSNALMEAVKPLQSRGQFGRRDFDLHVFSLGFPVFNPDDPLHASLAELAARAEATAATTALPDDCQFQRARKIIRGALAQDGVAAEIDAAVEAVLQASGTLAAAVT